MKKKSNIRFSEHKHIDKEKWDRCVEGSLNPLFFGLSQYLDRIGPGWCAIIKGDYEAVLPLICKKKYFIHYIYHPYFTSRFDIFSGEPVDEVFITKFLKAIPTKFKLIDLKINSSTVYPIKGFEVYPQKTYELNLKDSYKVLEENYSSNHKRNIKKAYESGIRVVKSKQLDNYLELTRELLKTKKKINIKENHFNMIFNTLDYANKKGFCNIYDVYDTEDNICGSGCFLEVFGRTIKYSATNDIGKKNNAGYLILDTYIKENSESNIMLDFAGSNIEQIAYFNKGFGGKEKLFMRIYSNRLAYPLYRCMQILKK